MNRVLPDKRPMDNVHLSPFEPQEDEFALIRMGSESPLERLFFYNGSKYFLSDYNKYNPQGNELVKWKHNLLTFYRKITYLTGKQIVSKNPYHTMRISLLAEMFPGAKFIYLTRDPVEVVPSTMRMWNIIASSDNLGAPWHKPSIHEVTSVLKNFTVYMSHTRHSIATGNFTEVCYSKLEKEPVKEVRRVYAELNLEYTDDLETNIYKFLNTNNNYVKNEHHLSENEKEIIYREMKVNDCCNTLIN
jgi:omega-hydroxy-beta-dihydromenaquinone-9 sulfotransferase